MKMKLRTSTGRAAARLAIPLAILMAASVGRAQVQPILGGRVLDANPMVGSGGTNNPIAGYVPVNGNDIITGNVTGLGYFHARVPYGSPYDSRTNNPNQASFDRWLRISAGSNASAGPYLGQTQSFYLPQHMFATQSGNIAPGMVSNTVNGGNGVTLSGPQSVSPASGYNSANSSQPTTLLPIGAALPVRSFERVGIESINPYTSGTDTSPLYGLRAGIDYQVPVPGGVAPPETPAAKPSETDIEDQPPALRTDAGVNAQRVGNAGEKPLKGRVDDRLPASEPRDEFVGQTNKPALKDMGNAPLRVSEEYQGLFADLQQKGQSATQEPAGSMTNTLTIRPRANPSVAARTGQTGSRTALHPGQPPATPDGVKGEEQVRRPPEIPNARLPQPAVKDLLAKASGQLLEGKYFDAGENYQHALDQDPNNMTAAMGRADAELAGGLYESAAYDYRVLFEAQPALLTTHRDLTAALGAKRIAYLTKDLTELSTRPRTSHALFLLAYLYYQTDNQPGLKQTLDAWTKIEPQNSGIEGLRKAWTEKH